MIEFIRSVVIRIAIVWLEAQVKKLEVKLDKKLKKIEEHRIKHLAKIKDTESIERSVENEKV
jgi:hypothetical protein